jgi:hypothetical protein
MQDSSSNNVDFTDGTYAINATGNSQFTWVGVADATFIQAGSGGNAITFTDDVANYTWTLGSPTYAGFLQDAANSITTYLCDGTNSVTANADIEITDSSKWVILTSPDLTRWRLQVDNSGTLTVTSL